MLNLLQEVKEMSFNYSKLKARIIEKFGTQKAFAEAFGVTDIAFSRKLNNKARFSTDDILNIIRMLEIPKSEITEYFFKEKV